MYSLVFLTTDFPLLHFIEARIYSFLAVCCFTAIGFITYNPPLFLWVFYLPPLLLLISAILLLLIKVPIPKYNQRRDAAITYGLAQPLLFISFLNIKWTFELDGFFPIFEITNSTERSYFLGITITILLVVLNAVSPVLLSKHKRLRPYLLLLINAQAFLMLAITSWHGILANFICQAVAVFLMYYPDTIRKAVAYAAPFLAAALTMPPLSLFWGNSPTFIVFLLGLGCVGNYLHTVLSRPAAYDGLPKHLSLAYHCVAWMGIALPLICHTPIIISRYIYPAANLSVGLVSSFREALFVGLVLSSLLATINLGYTSKTVIRQTVQTPKIYLSTQNQRFLEVTDQSSIPDWHKLTVQPADATKAKPENVNTPVTVNESPQLLIFVLYSSIVALLISASLRYSLGGELVVLAGMLLGLMSVFTIVNAKPRIHCGILVRALLAWAGLQILFAKNSYSLGTQVLLICAICAALAVVSIFAYCFSEGTHKNSEKYAALVLSAITLVLTFTFFNIIHSSETSWQRLICALILLALMLAWFRTPREAERTVAQSALVIQSLTLFMLPLFTTSQGTLNSYGLLASGFLIAAGAKLCAVCLPELSKLQGTEEQNYLGKWGYRHNRAIALSGIVYATFIFVIVFAQNAIIPAILAAIILTLSYALQSKTAYQPIVLIVGINLALLRIFIARDTDNSFFYVCQAIVMSLSMLLILNKVRFFAEHHKPKKELFWTAFSIQGLLVLALQAYVGHLSVADRLLMVFVSALLLGASAVFRLALQPILVTILMTYQVLYLLGGINIITLFALGFLLIALVIWRLLARKEDGAEAPKALSATPASHPTTATSPVPSQDQSFAGVLAQPSGAEPANNLQVAQTPGATSDDLLQDTPEAQQPVPPVAPWSKA